MNLNLSPTVQLYLLFPANLGFCMAHASREIREKRLQKVVAELDKEYPSLTWSLLPGDDLPSTPWAKGGLVRGLAKKSSQAELSQHIQQAVADSKIAVALAGEVIEEAIYFEHGIVNAAYTIPLRIASLDDIAELPKVALSIIGKLRDEEHIALFSDWERFRTAMRDSMARTDALYDMWGILMSGEQGRGPIMCVSQSFLFFTTQESNGIAVAEERLPELMVPMTGLKAEDNQSQLTAEDGILYLSVGLGGQVAISPDVAAGEWLKTLWLCATDYWAVLSDLDGHLYQNTLAMTQKERLSSKAIRRRIEVIRRLEIAVELLGHETIPSNFGDTSAQSTVYRGIYDSWETGPLHESVKGKLEFLQSTHDGLSDRLNDQMQERMNVVMATFTFLTFAGVLADVISSVDFNGSHFATPARFMLIVAGTVAGVLFSVLIGMIVFRRSHPDN